MREEARSHALAWARRAAFYYVFFVLVSLQGLFVLVDVLGMDFDPYVMLGIMPAAAPIGLAAWRLWAERDRPVPRLEPWYHWLILGFGVFSFWPVSYFFVGLMTDPAQVRLLPQELDRFIPFRPSFVFLYLQVYPFFLLPFFRVTRTATVHRTAIGHVVMLLVAYAVFLSMPVAFDRPVLPASPSSFAMWTIDIVYGKDPPWNCLPSTHCAVAMLSALALCESGNRRLGAWAVLTALSIGVSTLFTKQHYVVDMVAGYTLAAVTYGLLRWIWSHPDRLPEPARQFITAQGR